MNKQNALLISLCWLLCGCVQASTYSFEKISIEEGLSQSSVNAIAQDSKGFLWLGTQDGLNRYDGREFKIFKKDPFDSTSLSENFITALLVDKNDHIWIGTATEGLAIKGPGENEMLRLRHLHSDSSTLSNNQINAIYQTADGHIWVATANGFNKLRFRKGSSGVPLLYFERFLHYSTLSRNIPAEHFIRSMYLDSQGFFWVGTNQGIYRYQYGRNGSLTNPVRFMQPESGNWYRSKASARSICQDRKGRIWAGTNNGLFYFDRFSQNFLPYQADQLQQGLSSNHVQQVMLASNGNLLVATDKGLNVLHWNEGEYARHFNQIVQQAGNSQFLQARMIQCLWEDQLHQGLIWMGSYLSGLNKMYVKKKKFNTYHPNEEPALANVSPSIKYILKDGRNRIWIGLEEGLVIVDREKNRYRLIPAIVIGDRRFKSTMINRLFQDSKQNIWAGSYLGLLQLYEAPDGSIQGCRYWDDSQCEEPGIYAFFEDEEQYVVGTNVGIKFLDKKTDILQSCSMVLDSTQAKNPNYYVTDFLKDRSGNFWIATSNGLVLFRNIYDHLVDNVQCRAEIFYHDKNNKHGLVDNHISDIQEDTEGNIFLATMNGLAKVTLDKSSKVRFETFGVEEGLANNVVYGALLDEEAGELWLSTNNGLSRFQPFKNQFITFKTDEGLQSNEFNGRAFFKASDGELFFGGVNGFTSFYPQQIELEDHIPPVWLTSLTTNNQHTYDLLNLKNRQGLELPYPQNSVSIKFVGIDYLYPRNLRYFYSLEGEQDHNGQLGSEQQINLQNLKPGYYSLCIKAISKDGVTNYLGDCLHFTIRSPYWKKAWFFASLTLLLVLLTSILYHLSYRFKMNKIAEIEEVRKSAAQDFHDELGSKLSIISMYSELTKKKVDQNNEEATLYLDKISHTTSSLYESMRGMLWALNPEQDTINDLFLQLKDFGEELFLHSDIAFNCEGLLPDARNSMLPMKYKRHLLLIFKETMNNVLRHSQAQMALLSMAVTKNKLDIALRDDGVGFEVDQDFKGEGLKNIQSRAAKIGCELTISSGSEGSTVQIVCPLS